MLLSDLALSTMWNYPTAKTGGEMMRTIAELGFSKVELNYQVREEFLPEIERELASGKMRASSLHNVFPKVEDSRFDTDSLLLGYLEDDLRRQAVDYSKRTIDWAARLGAGAVVFHPTEVPLDPMEFDRPLKQLILEGRRNTKEYRELFARLLQKRQAGPYMDALKKSLNELCTYVEKRGYSLYLGMENRSKCHQVPIFSEFEAIMEEFGESPVKLWLDTGHGIMMEEIGLECMPLSERLTGAIIGMHIHDARDGRDHYPPGMLGKDVLAPYLPLIDKAPIKVLEVSSRYPAEAVRAGAEWLLGRMKRWSEDQGGGGEP